MKKHLLAYFLLLSILALPGIAFSQIVGRATRIVNAEGLTGLSGLADYAYQEKISAYDKNGNIKLLERKANGVNWDNLIYSYDNCNQQSKVTDSGSASNGFKNGSSGDADDFSYDGNGKYNSGQ